MATLLFSFETGSVTTARIVNAICLQNDYQSIINGQPNPETKAQFARRMVKEFIIYAVTVQETLAARQAAEATIQPIDLT